MKQAVLVAQRAYLLAKKLIGCRLTYGELALIAGEGPCLRCVGHAVTGAPKDSMDTPFWRGDEQAR